MAAAIKSMKQYLSLVETRVKDAERRYKDQDAKASKVRVGTVRCQRLKANNDTHEAVADEVDDDNDANPVDETKSTAKPIPTRKRHFDPYDKDSEPNPESDEPEFKPGAKVLIHNPKTKHWDRSAIVINWRHGRTNVLEDGTQRVTRRALRPGERRHNNYYQRKKKSSIHTLG